MTRTLGLALLLVVATQVARSDDLREAARAGDVERVRLALASGDDPNGAPRSPTPLMEAAMGGHLAVLRLLVERGAHLDAQDQNGDRALHWAISHQRLESVDFLLARGADVHVRGHAAITPLLRAAACQSTPILRRVLAAGGRLSDRDQSGWGPVYIATIWSSAANLEVLLDAGGDPDETDAAGESSLVAAAARGDAPKITLLLQHGASTRDGDAAWRAAARLARDTAITRGPTAADARAAMALLQPFVGVSDDALVLAAGAGELTSVERLLSLGARVDAVVDGLTVLGAAAQAGHVDLVARLLARGAPREVYGAPGALELAATEEVAARLLDARPPCSQASLDQALRSVAERGEVAIARRLLAAGANAAAKDEHGLGPLQRLDRALEEQRAIVARAARHRGIPGWAMAARERIDALTAARPLLVDLLAGRDD